MSLALLRGSSLLVAVDFGVSSLKAIQVAPGNPPQLEGIAMLEVPDELREKHNERFAFQAEALPKLLREAGFRARRAVCSVSASTSLVQHLRLRREDPAPLQVQVEQQLRDRIGRPPSQLIIRFDEAGDVIDNERKFLEVICTVMPRETVLNHMNALKACRLEAVSVQGEHHSLSRVFELLPPMNGGDDDETTMYIDLGYGTTKVVIMHDHRIVLAKTVHFGGWNIDRAACTAKGDTIASARRKRLDMGLRSRAMAPVGVGGGDGGAMQPDDRTDAVESVLSDLTEEVELCVRHHGSVFPDRPVDRAIFVGGESRELELCARIARSLGIPGHVADPLSFLSRDRRVQSAGVDLDTPQPGFAVTLGLCLAPATT